MKFHGALSTEESTQLISLATEKLGPYVGATTDRMMQQLFDRMENTQGVLVFQHEDWYALLLPLARSAVQVLLYSVQMELHADISVASKELKDVLKVSLDTGVCYDDAS